MNKNENLLCCSCFPLVALTVATCEAREVILVVTESSQGFCMLSLEFFPLFGRFTELLLQSELRISLNSCCN